MRAGGRAKHGLIPTWDQRGRLVPRRANHRNPPPRDVTRAGPGGARPVGRRQSFETRDVWAFEKW
jgi:hypothetical protein